MTHWKKKLNNIHYQSNKATIYSGNNLDVLPTLPDNSVDAIVTDPPYELGFMGKTWDNSGIAYSVELWRECLRVLKPGGHLLAFGGTRTWHRLAVAIEDAGFEIRDNIAWLYGSGFPKSHNISKAIDKLHGAEREVVGSRIADDIRGGNMHAQNRGERHTIDITASATDEAKEWDGWGTALKPAHEPIVVARKPLIGTVAENVLTYGVGGLNIDATRIGFRNEADKASATPQGKVTSNLSAGAAPDTNNEGRKEVDRPDNSGGRFPANIILDEFTAELLDEQSDASRFFYVAKASKRDRNEGLEDLPEQILQGRDAGQDDRQVPYKTRSNPVKNIHPTVKPTALMQYLIRLVTPPDGVVLDPFCGSGSTGKAAILENKQFIGIELTEDYLPIIVGRMKHAEEQQQPEEDDLFA
jgi:site-specific DNA-methyltransferase (adenine-specific)